MMGVFFLIALRPWLLDKQAELLQSRRAEGGVSSSSSHSGSSQLTSGRVGSQTDPQASLVQASIDFPWPRLRIRWLVRERARETPNSARVESVQRTQSLMTLVTQPGNPDPKGCPGIRLRTMRGYP